MANVADIRNGLCIELNGDLWQIVEFLHVKPGKGPAFVRTKLKSLTSGKVVDNTFNGSANLVTARIERKQYQYLYKDETGYNFMDNETFDQVSLPEALVENADLMREGDQVDVLIHAETGKTLSCELPQFVEMEVTYTEPGLRGNTATNTLKLATVETGAEIKVPLFINIGDRIKIDTHERAYVERVK
ncbi:MAG: elongation factor P [Chitinophagales bacterium]|nr:elongation factor P [Chitinophagales bacterium]